MSEKLVCENIHHHDDSVKDTLQKLPEQQTVEALANTFKVFSDPGRVKILCALSIHEMCVQGLCDIVGMSQSAASHQLRLLRTARLVKTRREGKSIFYSLDDEHITSILYAGLTHVNEKV
ncbi:MAG: helix-turn-helix transcriptional regulator [Oscillospiraceae bacterium]|nr:helix-turn-helix transcriptional regulator [Oscillospiraceae bacterium]